MVKLDPIQAATQFIAEQFPNCQGAVLGGSVVRGEATETSDLDIVIFDESLQSSFRESLTAFGWPIEIFVHNLFSYRYFFEMDCKDAIPTMPRMVSEGIVIKDEGIIQSIKQEAIALLSHGPEKWSDETIIEKRYFITDVLDDFIGSKIRAEEIFIANTLANLVHEFVLRINGHWIGSSKWIVRALKIYDEKFAQEFVDAFDKFYQSGEKDNIIAIVDKVLEPYGGRLFDGFLLGEKIFNR
ncbi:nucleotidyltransferase domain-containing protein [Bacillus sp. FJAT-49732]|uniref:Nucleotidyltransferase domain-containing protein n=1 Tax=Lederbergia citrisecunda TaxID=2833583 RepID=A0A942TP76_9BACI|nr:nucleotidyltransferase domain-containing protein [Lederbergia citrisecunda]MBS4200903.1 nucleotidyltransferase domain-containing protein [Lederbergia citrisecunda]